MTNIRERNQEIRDLFTSEKMTISQLSRYFNISRERVRQILIEQKINTKQLRSEKESRLADQIQNFIMENPGLSKPQIARHFKLSVFKLEKLMKKTGINIDRGKIASRARLTINNNNHPVLTRERLHQLYVVENNTIKQIAEILDRPLSTVARYLKRFEIAARYEKKRHSGR